MPLRNSRPEVNLSLNIPRYVSILHGRPKSMSSILYSQKPFHSCPTVEESFRIIRTFDILLLAPQ